MARRTSTIHSLDEHPQRELIGALLVQVAHLTDDQLRKLGKAWRNTVSVAAARRQALEPESPLVVDVLIAFEGLGELYAEELSEDPVALPGLERVPSDTVYTALKAVRDVIAAAYARPVLTRGEYAALTAAWRSVMPRPGSRFEPDFGPESERVQHVLSALDAMSRRCHESEGRRLFDGLLVQAMTLDTEAHDEAMAGAYRAAMQAGRHRPWAVVRRAATQALSGLCGSCRRVGNVDEGPYDAERVAALAADATAALLVTDQVAPEIRHRLTEPLVRLIPAQRQQGGVRRSPLS